MSRKGRAAEGGGLVRRPLQPFGDKVLIHHVGEGQKNRKFLEEVIVNEKNPRYSKWIKEKSFGET